MSDHFRPRATPQSRDDEYRRLFEESRDAIVVSTVDGWLVDINPAGVRLFGYDSREDMLSLDVAADLYWNPEDRKRPQADLLAHGAIEDREIEVKTRSGGRLRVQETASAIYGSDGEICGSRSILRDVTAQRRLEEQLRQSQKMEAVGRLAEGVAHDFNNLLTAINGYSELTLVQIPEDDPLRAGIAEIRQAGKRAAELTRRLLTLSRHQVSSPRNLELNRVVRDMEKLLQRVLGEDIELETTLDRELPAIFVDQSQIEQIILNLAIKARDAMPSGGRLALETTTRTAEADPHEGFVELAVRDTGEGMSSEALERLFEPSSTITDLGRDARLGLAVAHRSVQQCGGHVAVESTLGSGSTFRLFFPPAPAPVVTSAVDLGHLATALPRGHETILLVEDETTVLDLVRRILEAQGYQVLAAHDADAALKICGQLVEHPDLLLTDVVMPRTNGPVLAENLQELYPDLKVLFMSGYTDSHTGVRLLNERRAAFLPKPFSPEILAHKVREILDEFGPPARA